MASLCPMFCMHNDALIPLEVVVMTSLLVLLLSVLLVMLRFDTECTV